MQNRLTFQQFYKLHSIRNTAKYYTFWCCTLTVWIKANSILHGNYITFYKLFWFYIYRSNLPLVTVLITAIRKTKQKSAAYNEANRSMDFRFRAWRNIAPNNPPIHHCWSWQLKNNVPVSIVRAEPFIIKLPEFQFADLRISDSIQAVQLNVKSELTNYK